MKRYSTVLFFFLVALGIISARPTPRKSPELVINVPGRGPQLLSHYRGKVVALEFILITCPHCQAASRVMNRLQERYGSQGFQSIDVAIDPNADLLVENVSKEHQAGFPVGWARLEQMMNYMEFQDRPVVPPTPADRSQWADSLPNSAARRS